MKHRSLMSEMLHWLIHWNQTSVAVLLLIMVVSALGVVYSAHLTRQMYAELQTLQKEQDDLDSQYEKLLLEQSAWANYSRVDQVAREELAMKEPDSGDLVVVRQ